MALYKPHNSTCDVLPRRQSLGLFRWCLSLLVYRICQWCAICSTPDVNDTTDILDPKNPCAASNSANLCCNVPFHHCARLPSTSGPMGLTTSIGPMAMTTSISPMGTTDCCTALVCSVALLHPYQLVHQSLYTMPETNGRLFLSAWLYLTLLYRVLHTDRGLSRTRGMYIGNSAWHLWPNSRAAAAISTWILLCSEGPEGPLSIHHTGWERYTKALLGGAWLAEGQIKARQQSQSFNVVANRCWMPDSLPQRWAKSAFFEVKRRRDSSVEGRGSNIHSGRLEINQYYIIVIL